MASEYISNLYKDLMIISKSIVVKRDDLANINETFESIKNYELYSASLKGDDFFFNFGKLDENIVAKNVPPSILSDCIYNRNNIPTEYRKQIIADSINKVIAEFEEKNNYYRMLMGIPDVEDTNFIYITDNAMIDPKTPIHKLSFDIIASLETSNILDKIQKENPTKLYLLYLGQNSIDLIKARTAKPFDILRMDSPSNTLTKETFIGEYYRARRYVMSTCYNRQLFSERALYDPIMGIIILSLAIRNTLVPDERSYLNFEEILNNILESYGILTYFKKLPMTYKRRLVLSLDKLFMNKGTDGVLVDICKLFSYDAMVANRYYMLKTQNKDVNGNLIFAKNPDGTDDVDKMYNLDFIKVNVEVPEISLRGENIVDYDSVISNDYLWQLNDDETKKIKSEEFNLIMSKYVSIEAAYELSKLTYEVNFFINLLLDSQLQIQNIKATNMYSSSGYSNAFTMVIFLLATLSKRAGYDGNILYSPAHIAEVYQFNLDDISADIQNLIDKYDLKITVSDLLLSKPAYKTTENEITMVYLTNTAIYDRLQKEIDSTVDYHTYIGLTKIKKLMFVSTMNQKNFTKSDGTVALTYLDMLKDLDHKLWNLITTTPQEDLDNILLYVMEKLENLFNNESLKYLFINTPNTSGNLIAKYLKQAVEIFKASSVQLTTMNIFFRMGEYSPIRVFDEIIHHTIRHLQDATNIKEYMAIHKTIFLTETLYTNDKIQIK